MFDLRFTKTHEWVKIEDDKAVVGITDYAQKELGDLVFVELPGVGEKVKQSLQFGTIESTKAASEVYAPLTGEVVETHKELIDNPQWINESPYTKGWMIKIKIDNIAEVQNLLGETAYKEFVEKEK